jgi:O-antigen ligase
LQLAAVSSILVSAVGIFQFFGFNIFKLTSYIAPLSMSFRTTLGHVNLVSSYCAFTAVLFTVLFTVSHSKWKYLYFSAAVLVFALSLTTGFSGDTHILAILVSMILIIPYWISKQERLGRLLITLSGWCVVYTGHSIYMSVLKRQYKAGVLFSQYDGQLLNEYTEKNILLFSVAAVMLFAAGLALILCLKKWNEKLMKTAGIISLPVILISGLIGLEVTGSQLSDQPYNIIWQARETMHGRLNDDYGTYRGWIWRNAVEVIPDNPVFGTGPDTFYHALGTERQAESAARYNLNHDRAHNIFLQIAVCMGIPALIAYLIFLGSVFIPSIKRAFERPALFAFGAAALSYMIQSFFSIEGPTVMPLFWVSLGIMANEVWMAKTGHANIEL